MRRPAGRWAAAALAALALGAPAAASAAVPTATPTPVSLGAPSPGTVAAATPVSLGAPTPATVVAATPATVVAATPATVVAATPVAPVAATPVAPAAATGSPFEPDAGSDDATPQVADRPSTARLDRVAAELRRTPLVVDPELEWTLDAKQQRALLRRLRSARIAVFVAVLPNLDEDESGGDTQRTLQRLQRQTGRDGLYVVVDQDGRMDLASVGVRLDLGISYSLLSPPYDPRSFDEQARDPAPPGWTSISERLGKILDTVAKAGPGEPNAVIDDVDALEPLSGTSTSNADREDAIAAAITGTLLGLLVAGLVLGIAAAVRSAKGGAGPGAPGRAGTIDAGRLGTGGATARRPRGRRRGRRRRG